MLIHLAWGHNNGNTEWDFLSLVSRQNEPLFQPDYHKHERRVDTDFTAGHRLSFLSAHRAVTRHNTSSDCDWKCGLLKLLGLNDLGKVSFSAILTNIVILIVKLRLKSDFFRPRRPVNPFFLACSLNVAGLRTKPPVNYSSVMAQYMGYS